MPENCPFCEMLQGNLLKNPGVLFVSRHFFAVQDAFPVNKGHVLLIPKRHIASPFDLHQDESEALPGELGRLKTHLQDSLRPDGYNIGVNIGEAAGQTVFHLHIHVIPRYQGDVKNPRGGIRNLKKPLVKY